jgi:hypothetical protein
MKPIVYLQAALLFVGITNPSGDCTRIMKTVPVDYIRYFKADQIRLEATDFKDTSLQLKLDTGTYTFIRDTSKWYFFKADKDKGFYLMIYFNADKDDKSFYEINEIHPNQVTDTSVIATIHYMGFDKKKQTNTTGRRKLKNCSISLSAINSFTTTIENYNQAFPAKK